MDGLTFYSGFVVPFIVGTSVLFAVIVYKYVRWFARLPRRDKLSVRRGMFSGATVAAAWECLMESLLHRRIWRVNPALGYMHTSFALGWFLLIAVGWIETVAYLGGRFVPLQGHIFFKYFTTELQHGPRWGVNFEAVMDLLLLYVLSGVALALFKRLRSRAMGMRRTTQLRMGDRVAMASLWFIFPMRLLAESFTSGIHGSGGFLTGGLGGVLATVVPAGVMPIAELGAWWGYSIALGVFFVSMPFSRYMHIFTEIPLIFLRRWGVRGEVGREKSFDHFQLEACSRCGICIDPCQMQRDGGMTGVQSVYFIRDRRYNRLSRRMADSCMACGRCEAKCPVGLELDTLRVGSRYTLNNTPSNDRWAYARGGNGRSDIAGASLPSETAQVGYFAGCMTLLSPRILRAMESVFAAAGEDVWWADREGGVCCGRPMKLAGEVDAARDMMKLNEELFRRHGITTLVTSCPICLRVFREDYSLRGIEVLHHSEYFQRLVAGGRISLKAGSERLTYHDPCELGRGCGIYDEPREVLRAVGELAEPSETREEALCCGSSIAGNAIGGVAQTLMGRAVGRAFEATGASCVVTACPLCKKALARGTELPVLDLAEVVERHLMTAADSK
ncbi:MAG: (Fe-S)-binding protein [Alistipes sp.]|jgi:Fe-S oxidoreductase|nr:(Fe-S)-binding protein [Alistipes sp.]